MPLQQKVCTTILHNNIVHQPHTNVWESRVEPCNCMQSIFLLLVMWESISGTASHVRCVWMRTWFVWLSNGDAYTLSRRKLPCSGKLSREITFTNFAVLWLFAKVFYAKFGGVASLAQHRRAIRENHIFHQFAKVFFLESFPLYGNCQRFCYTSSSEVGNRVHKTLLPYWNCYCMPDCNIGGTGDLRTPHCSLMQHLFHSPYWIWCQTPGMRLHAGLNLRQIGQ